MTAADRSVITVRVKPRAHRDEVRRDASGEFEVRIAAPPAEGAANERLLRVLAEHLGIARTRLRIVSGRGSRLKRIAVDAPPG